MKCEYCKDGKYFGLHFIDNCTYCNGTGFKEAPVPPPTSTYITVGQLEDSIISLMKHQVQGQYNPALTVRGCVSLNTTVMLNLDPVRNPTIKDVENNTAFRRVVTDLVGLIDKELFKIHGGLWCIHKPVSFSLGFYGYNRTGLTIDWTNPGKNPRRLQIKGKVNVG